jgi:hypothetical protein
MAIWAFRGSVAITCITAWTIFLDVRDLKTKVESYEKPDAVLPGGLSRKDWEYEKKLLLVEHELIENEIETLRMQLDEIRSTL